MADPKYKLKKGTVRSPEEHRKILDEIDTLQRKRSAVGVHKSKQRIFNTFGVSSTAYKKKRKPKNTKPKVHMREMYSSSFASNLKHDEGLSYTKKKYL